jgi:hypothetical protein
MDVTPSDDDARTLQGLLYDCLAELRFEVARTGGNELRRALVKRQELCEQLLDSLQPGPR